MAEGGGRNAGLGFYLDEPLQLFIPVRLLIATCLVLAAVLIARTTGVQPPESIATLLVAIVGFALVCEHLIPILIVRRDPEAVLDVLLPVFHVTARIVQPLTMALITIGERRRGDREPVNGAPPGEPDHPTAERRQDAQEEHGISEQEGPGPRQRI